jgi:hypothetical protein
VHGRARLRPLELIWTHVPATRRVTVEAGR